MKILIASSRDRKHLRGIAAGLPIAVACLCGGCDQVDQRPTFAGPEYGPSYSVFIQLPAGGLSLGFQNNGGFLTAFARNATRDTVDSSLFLLRLDSDQAPRPNDFVGAQYDLSPAPIAQFYVALGRLGPGESVTLGTVPDQSSISSSDNIKAVVYQDSMQGIWDGSKEAGLYLGSYRYADSASRSVGSLSGGLDSRRRFQLSLHGGNLPENLSFLTGSFPGPGSQSIQLNAGYPIPPATAGTWLDSTSLGRRYRFTGLAQQIPPDTLEITIHPVEPQQYRPPQEAP